MISRLVGKKDSFIANLDGVSVSCMKSFMSSVPLNRSSRPRQPIVCKADLNVLLFQMFQTPLGKNTDLSELYLVIFLLFVISNY
jgi:hypothetical protein